MAMENTQGMSPEGGFSSQILVSFRIFFVLFHNTCTGIICTVWSQFINYSCRTLISIFLSLNVIIYIGSNSFSLILTFKKCMYSVYSFYITLYSEKTSLRFKENTKEYCKRKLKNGQNRKVKRTCNPQYELKSDLRRDKN